jgi:hypothetical protein
MASYAENELFDDEDFDDAVHDNRPRRLRPAWTTARCRSLSSRFTKWLRFYP